MAGVLSGIRIIEFAGIGPGPFCGMMLADHGAEVIRIDRPGSAAPGGNTAARPLLRSRRSVALDLKRPEAKEVARDLCRNADGLIEGYRPGVMERLGLGPEVLLADNPKLVYGRVTGWGQYGPLAQAAGHDINYIAVTGALHTIGRAGACPVPPVNYLGDFGGGGMLLAFGIVAALLGVRQGAPGQVIDAAMTDGTALLSAMTWGLYADGRWRDEPASNMLDGAAHFYDTYRCADNKFVSIGAIEPGFYALLRDKLGLTGDADFDAQMDRARWPELKAKLAALFVTRTRDEWSEIMAGTDICFAPVMSLAEAPAYPHNAARGTFVTVAGKPQPAPAPRFSASGTRMPDVEAATDTAAVLADIGYDEGRISALRAGKIIGC